RRTRPCIAVNSGPIFALILIQGGLRSIGVSALRASMRSKRRPSGPMWGRVTAEAYAQATFRPKRNGPYATEVTSVGEATTPGVRPGLAVTVSLATGGRYRRRVNVLAYPRHRAR